jgi:Ca-activated chloride channel family protein
MFRFATPLAFLLLVPWALAAWRLYRRGRPAGVLYAPFHRLPARTAGWRHAAARILPAVFLLGTALTIVAAARPQTFFSRERRTVDAIAMMMAVDVSGSMEALDLSERTPAGWNYLTRLDVVKRTFARFIERRPDDMIGLVTFGGYPSTRSPLTADHRALLHVLQGCEIPRADVDAQGQPVSQEELLTAIGDGLATACARLSDAEPKTRLVVLLSDGESNTGQTLPDTAAEAAAKLGIRVYTIGVGSTGKAPARGRDPFGREVIGTIDVRLDEAQLRRIASRTGGRYFNVRDGAGFREAMETIDRLETTRVERNVYRQYNERFAACLAAGAGLSLLALSAGMTLSRRAL